MSAFYENYSGEVSELWQHRDVALDFSGPKAKRQIV